MNSPNDVGSKQNIKDVLREKVAKNQLAILSKVKEKKYKCSFCFYSSDNIHIVRQHLITHYVKPQVCPFCQEVPTTKCNRKALYRQDKSRFKAKECWVVFSQKSENCDVTFTANYVCELCGKRFRCILHSEQKKRQIVLLNTPSKKDACVKVLKESS